MLKLQFGRIDGELLNPDVWFKNAFDYQLLLTDFSKKAIQSIDKSEVIDAYCIKSPVLGGISPEWLSSGVKCILILKYTDKVINLVNCGDNCFDLIKEISLEKDIQVSTSRFVNLFRRDEPHVPVMITNNNENKVVTDLSSFWDMYDKYDDCL